MKLKILPESIILIGICVLDMLATLYLICNHLATEQNPIMAFFINKSPWLFALVKLANIFALVVALEIYYKKNPKIARFALRWSIGLYLGLYTIIVIGLNWQVIFSI